MTPSIDKTLHQFFTLLLILTLLLNLTFYLIVRGFHRTFATGAVCQQRTLTPPDTWSCPTLGLVSVLMLKPISPELFLFPDVWVSNIPRYFCFCLQPFLTSFLHTIQTECVKIDLTLSNDPQFSMLIRGVQGSILRPCRLAQIAKHWYYKFYLL